MVRRLRELLTDILRGEWGFDGFVISDWIFGMRDAARSLHAGLDIEMPWRMIRFPNLPAALDSGEASWDDVDSAVTNVIATLLRFDAVLSKPAPPMSIIGAPEHVALAREVAARSVVLLRNEPIGDRPMLPLDASARQLIAVIGELSDQTNLGDGGSSDVYSLDNATVLDGITARLRGDDVIHDDGSEIARAVEAAAQADVAIVVVGYTADDEGEFIGDTGTDLSHLFPAADEPEVVAAFEASMQHNLPTVKPDHLRARPGLGFSKGGDRQSIRLRPHDEALIEAVVAVNYRTVVVIQAGSAVVMADWNESVPAIVQAWYGGQQAGHGLADVLFGDVNPSARLPFTVAADESHLPDFDREADHVVYDRWHGWWRAEHEGHIPTYPFGFGLSYTTFELGPFHVESDRERDRCPMHRHQQRRTRWCRCRAGVRRACRTRRRRVDSSGSAASTWPPVKRWRCRSRSRPRPTCDPRFGNPNAGYRRTVGTACPSVATLGDPGGSTFTLRPTNVVIGIVVSGSGGRTPSGRRRTCGAPRTRRSGRPCRIRPNTARRCRAARPSCARVGTISLGYTVNPVGIVTI